MDAKITKQRLANFLSYDWLKILISVVAVVVALVIFFTTVQTRPRKDQVYELYAYYGLLLGEDGYDIADIAPKEKTFSYDVLSVGAEAFDNTGLYGGAAYSARRAAGQGEVLFLAPVPAESGKTDENGNPVEFTHLDEFMQAAIADAGTENETLRNILEFDVFTLECESYLSSVFGENWETSDVPDDGRVREIFLQRNGKDKRFRTEAKKEKGIAQERERLIGLRSAYLAVESAIAEGIFAYTTYTSESGKVYTIGLNIGGNEEGSPKGLGGLSNLVYYRVESEEDKTLIRTARDVTLTVFNNGRLATDLRYDVFFLLQWMMNRYGAAQQ